MTFHHKDDAPFAQANDTAPFAMSIRAYMRRSGNSRSRTYDLLRDGELEYYFEGSKRKITMRSIEAREARLLAEAKADTRLGRDITKRDSRSESPPTTSRKPRTASTPPDPTHAAE